MLAKGGSLQTVLKSFLGLVDTGCCVIFPQFWPKCSRITLQKLIGTLIVDEYGHKIIKGQIYLKGHNLENKGYHKKNIKNKLMTKTLYFFKENIMYSLKNFEIHN